MAQPERVVNAISLLQAGEILKAQVQIDSALLDGSVQNDPEAWYIKGYVYKELYKKLDVQTRSADNRLKAVEAFERSIKLDSAKQKEAENKKNVKVIATSFYNDAAAMLQDTSMHSKALTYYNHFKKAMVLADPSFNFVKKDIEFNLYQAQMFSKIYDANRKAGEPYLERSKNLYLDVLKVDSNNFSANYNLGILYYNQAVNIINEMDYDVDIFELSNTQDNTIQLFKKSLPYMERAYKLDPNKKETLIGLSGIYFSLNEEDKSKAFKAKADALGSTPEKK
jgi:tetratricopeptide (TPR) repeat protein